MTAAAPAPPALLVTTSARVPPELLEAAIARARGEHERLHVVIPAVLPPTLPISAMPPPLAVRVDALRRAAAGALARLGAAGRVEIVRSRDARSALLAATVECPARWRGRLVSAPRRARARTGHRGQRSGPEPHRPRSGRGA